MKTFKDIIAWQKAYTLTLRLYKATSDFPSSEEFGLKSQIRRATVSVISNIAEGFKRMSKKDQVHFYKIAESSLEEVKCQTMLAHDLNYLSSDLYQEICKIEDESGRVLRGWIKSQG